jgi:beta-fructofuranosidase
MSDDLSVARTAAAADDPQRPQYHFLPPEHWLNDPNGLIQWRGLYHLFYQYNPNGPFHGTIHWGHASSPDLVHWTHLPVALAPTPGGPDADGCWSGCAVDDNGVPTLIYSGHAEGRPGNVQLPCLATGDPELLTWTKYPGNPLLAAPPAELDLLEFRDHSVWKEGDTWYQVIGAGIRDVGGAALLFRSQDLRRWDYLHPLAVGDLRRSEPLWTGSVWECPEFFRLGTQHVLIVSAWHQQTTLYATYMLGAYQERRFTVEREGFVDLGGSLYAPQSMLDDRGRRIMFGWLREGRSLAAQRAAGWSGVISLPRVLSIAATGELALEPAPELAVLRRHHEQRCGIQLQPDVELPLEGIAGTQLEIAVEWLPGDATLLGLKVRCAPDGAEATLIGYDLRAQRLFIDRQLSSLSADVERDPRGGRFALAPGEPLRLRVFVDGSVVEVFANGRACLSERVYPTRADSCSVALVARGGIATVAQLDAWQLGSVWLREGATATDRPD